MMLSVLFESAVRSLLLGFVVWAALKLTRLYDSRTETAIWTAVLIAAWSMPLLCRHAPGLVLTLPQLPQVVRVAPAHNGLAGAWADHAARTAVMGAYLLGVSVCGLRLALGLLLSVRLYRGATPVRAAWVQARNIRATAALEAPVSLAGAILLPADHGEWSAAKRSAVLAHEEAHIARGDFFVQLAAALHCAVFWFSPFAWWLQTKLAEIAETASDEAAIRRLNDRAAYAEILVEVARRAQKSPLIVAMAKSSFIQQRVERILSEAPRQSLSRAQRVSGVALFAVLAIAVAGAKTVVVPIGAAAQTRAVKAAGKRASPESRTRGMDSPRADGARAVRSAREPREAPPAAPVRDDARFNPRALLDPVYAPPTDRIPVADVSVTYAMERRIH